MKRLILFLTGIIIFLADGLTQNVQFGINYQGVARDPQGLILQNTPLNIKFSIIPGSVNNTPEYVEEHNGVMTNNFGVFTVIIGNGDRKSVSAITLDQVHWSENVYYLKTEMAINGGSYNYIGQPSMITWVPYALYALKSGSNEANITATFDSVNNVLSIGDKTVSLSSLKKQNTVATFNTSSYQLTIGDKTVDLSVLKDGDALVSNLSISGNFLNYQKGSSTYQLDLSKYLDNTDSQNLSLNGQVLKISNGNEVTLPIQTLSIDGNTLKLSNGGGSVTVDPSPDNEIQLLRLNADTVELYRPGQLKSDSKVLLPDLFEDRDTIYMKGYPKPRKISLNNILSVTRKNQLSINRGNTVNIDTDTTNEIQDLNITGDVLKITKNNEATAVDLSVYKDNTDNQTLNLNYNDSTLSVSGGNSVKIGNMINVPWVAFSASSPINLPIDGVGKETLVSWNEEFDDGYCLDNSTFTAPAKGVYQFNFNLLLSAQNYLSVKVYKNTSLVIRNFDLGSTNQISHAMLLKLNAGESIQIKILNSASFTNYLLSGYFSGYRVH